MALIRFGGGVVQMSGSIAGNTFARNRFGNYVRARTTPVDPRSSRQTAARMMMAYLAEQWRESPMTDTYRGEWETYAAAVNWQNALGETVKLTGFQHFIRSNSRILQQGFPLVDTGPTTLTLPGADATFAAAATADDQMIAITFDDTEEWCDIDEAGLVIQQGLGNEQTRFFYGGPFRWCDSIDGDSVTPPSSGDEVAAAYTLVTGQKVWVRGSIVLADGRCSDWFYAAPLTVAAS